MAIVALHSASALALVLFVSIEICAIANVSRLRSFRGGTAAHIAVPDVERSLQDLLQAAHSGGNSSIARRLGKIETSIATTFQALPKNAVGRITPRSVRYIVHNYFAKEHGWQIKGLEPEGMRTNMSNIHDVTILNDQAPALVEALLEAHRSNTGLTLEDVAAMLAMLERLILDQSLTLLQAAYHLNDLSPDDRIGANTLHSVLQSYLLLFQMGLKGNLTDVYRHQAIKERMAARSSWATLVEFETDAVLNYEFQTRDISNPFKEQALGFEKTTHIMEILAEDYGKWQNSECSRMKSDLMDRDVDGSGRIPLSRFYADSSAREYRFTEKVEYLRQIGALEDDWKGEPRVRIANYITGPSNCIASSSYYSVCCLNECTGLLNELEGNIKAPTATADQLLRVVRNLTSSSMWMPRVISPDTVSKLHAIAHHNDGVVPLHGRLFAQWLHFVFPHECPFPHVTKEAATLTAHHWLGGKAVALEEDRKKHIEAAQAVAAETEMEPTAMQWSDEEVLPLQGPQESPAFFGSAIRIAVQASLFFVVAQIAFAALSTVRRSVQNPGKRGKKLDELPL